MPITSVRNRMSRALLGMVAGPDGAQARYRIHGTPGPRWYGAGSPIQIVHGDASMYIGGVRALLLQSLHPLAMAAVDDFSDYRTNVWGRLARTATFIATTTFGTAEHAQEAVDIVRAVHRRVNGTAPDGRPYQADDPHLLAWVHIAEIDSFLTAHERFGRRSLDEADYDTYVSQSARVALALGSSEVPTTRAELQHRLQQFRPELQSTPAARDVATFIHTVPVPVAVRPGYRALVRAAVATLPRWAREPLGLPDRPLLDRTLHRLNGTAMTSAIRWLTTAEPMQRPERRPPGPAAGSRSRAHQA
ncbi:oxygenase MpaB family protein [Pseudactinotalea sp. Z1748]|uniref:oxygenase MpaB family protein n=1 Tax=Pseudactinotalea sp. Z1748 TaxID=3413027 RepID=UPI003C7B4482